MVRLLKFAVSFTDDKTVYSPGDTVSGQLEIELDETMQMKEIRIKLSGKAHVGWNEGKNHYSNKERFFTESAIVRGGDLSSASEGISLSKGRHSFPFRFSLPTPLASSYEDNIGFIRYYVKARINKPWQIDNKTVAVITVLDTLNLNQISDAMAPSGGSESKNLCCWCCASGPIEGEVRTERKGYVPGEYVIANGTLSNYSSSRVRSTSLELVKLVSYYTPMRDKTVIVSLTQEYGPECRPRGEVNLTNVKLQIPPVPPSEALHCNIIDIQYAAMLMGHLRTCAINLRAFAPIVIGTVPLNNLRGDFSSTDVTQEAKSVDQAEAASQGTMGNLAPPPTYMAAVSGSFDVRGKDETTMGDQTYAPQYKYYDWNQTGFSYD